VKEFPSNTQLIRLAFSLAGVLLLLVFIFEDALSDSPHTLDQQLQWVCPLAVVDLKLVDFDGDGINEILVGFNSDSSRVGILDAVSQNMIWQSPGFDGSIYTVAAGDRNSDGYLDIVCGGQRADSSIGYVKIFDGPNFDSVHALSGFDEQVLSAAISARGLDSLPQIFLGTYYYSGGCSDWGCYSTYSGRLHVLDGRNLAVEGAGGGGTVRDIRVRDINGDTYEELFLGVDYNEGYTSPTEPDYALLRSSVSLRSPDYYHRFILYDIPDSPPEYVVFDALEVGSFSGGASYFIIAGGHWTGYWWDRWPKNKLACWNASTTELEWSMGWKTGTHVTDLAMCRFGSQGTNAICAAYPNGLIEFKTGTDGSNLAVILLLHSIRHLELGNLDWDPWVEMCVASRDSLYVYKTELWPRNDTPVVSEIPNQTIAEGENFTSFSLDDYVTDPDDDDSIMVWSHWGETDLLVDITDGVATITVPNPEWNGAETIWFKACDPGALCDSNEATFAVTAVNDTPAVTDIPDQTISEDQSFVSISLDDYVTDPDDHDSIMIWAHWGETELLVDITDRIVTITVTNPEWNGAESIWFKACDSGGLCDSNEAAFTVTAVNDRPIVSDIPNVIIAKGKRFASISLDDYVADPDDHDSVMIWSHWGETQLSVDITDRVTTVTVPNPEWIGVEIIWFKACDPGGLCDSNDATFTLHPKDFCLFQNYPNPFNPQTNIRFDLPVASNVTVTIYNILGEKIRTFDRRYEPGTHRLRWDGKNSSGEDVASGVYLYKLSAANYQETRKMVLIR
jgi:hypothetical protein